jgi:hypothetical protein
MLKSFVARPMAQRVTATRRFLSSKLTEAERDLKMKEANEKMRAYYTNRPPIELIQKSKRRSKARDREHYIQALVGE